MARKKKEEGVDLSTAAEMWTEEEIKQMIREEVLKIVGVQGQMQPSTAPTPNVQPNVAPYQWPTNQPQWVNPLPKYYVNHCTNTGGF